MTLQGHIKVIIMGYTKKLLMILIFLLIGTLILASSAVVSNGEGNNEYNTENESEAPQLSIGSVIPDKYQVEKSERINVTVTIENDGDGDALFVDVHYENNGEYQYFLTIDNVPAGENESVVFAFREENEGIYTLKFTGKDNAQEFDNESIDILVMRTIYVDDDAPDGGDGSETEPYQKIQDAIDAAEGRDTIRVFEGTYNENVEVNKAVSLIGNGSQDTTIDGGGSGNVVRITADRVNMSGFMITGSGSSGNPDYDSGIRIESDSNYIFENNISNNNNDGIFLDTDSEYNTLSENTVIMNAEYGIRLREADYNTIIQNIVQGNEDGIYLDQADLNTIADNIVKLNGIGIELGWSDDNTIEGNTISENTDDGIHLFLSRDNTLTQNTVKSNTNGIYLLRSDGSSVDNCTITENEDTGIFINRSSSNQISYNTVMENRIGLYNFDDSKDNNAYNNNIFNNTEYGIEASGDSVINATSNWWGDASGPHHLENNSKGKGDNVTDYVEFEPWLTSPYRGSQTWYVDDDAPDGGDGSEEKPFNTIQDAIDDAEDGDIIYIYEGNYGEGEINKTLHFKGENREKTITGYMIFEGNGGNSITNLTIEHISFENNCHKNFISNCNFINSEIGIKIDGSHNNTISNCTFRNNERNGIEASETSGNTIEFCTFENNSIYLSSIASKEEYLSNDFRSNTVNGKDLIVLKNMSEFTFQEIAGQIILMNCSDGIIKNQNISSSDVGIHIIYSGNITVIDSRITDNVGIGLYLIQSRNCIIDNCIIYGNENGIYLRESNNNTVKNCNIFDNHMGVFGGGIYLRESSNNLISNCWIHDHHSEISHGIMMIRGSNNNSIEMSDITNNTGEAGIKISIESDNNSIVNCLVSNNSYGIYLSYSSNNTLTSNTCSSNNGDGIYLEDSSHCTITNNTCENNRDQGIYFDDSDHNMLFNNTCSDNGDGIYLSFSDYNTLSSNPCNSNRGYGIYLYKSSNNNNLFLNILSKNRWGIYLSQSSDFNNLTNNTITENEDGIHLRHSCQKNTAHYNNIFANTAYGIVATYNNGYAIDAINNWWGDVSGPHHPVNNSAGKGDKITDYVLFDPWTGKLYTWYVDDDTPGGGNGSIESPFNKIQDAIDASGNGDTVRVFNGTYYENVVVNKSVNLIGNGSLNTTIDGGWVSPSFKLSGDGITVSGFSISKGSLAGIQILGNDILIDHCNVSSNDHGIYLEGTATGIPFAEIWNETFGGSRDDSLVHASPTSDGGFIITGNTESYGGSDRDIWLVKLNNHGELEWDRVIEKTQRDQSFSVIQTKDGGYLISAFTELNANDIWIVKTNETGIVEWEKNYGNESYDRPYAGAIETPDGGYVIAGYNARGSSPADAYLMKINLTGELLWEQFYGGSATDVILSFAPTPEGGYILAGYTQSHGNGDEAFVVKTDENGNKIWERYYGGSGDDRARSVVVLDDGYLFAGHYGTQNNERDIWLFKLDTYGNLKDSWLYGGPDMEEGAVLHSMEDGKFLLLGTTSSFGNGNKDIWLVKLQENFEEDWNVTFGGDNDDLGSSIITSANILQIFGRTKSYGAGDWDFWMLRYRDIGENITISNCTVSSNTKTGIHANGIRELTIKDCNIFNNTDHGISIQRSNSAIIEGNTLRSNGDAGLSFSLVKSSMVFANLFDTNDGNALSIVDSEGNVITKNSFSGKSINIALLLKDSSDNEISANMINDYENAIVSINSSDNIILNSTFAENTLDLNLTYNSDLTLVNTTFETVLFSDRNSTISVFWCVDLKVTDNRSGFISQAKLKITDRTNKTIFDGYTDDKGRIPQINIFDHNENLTSRTDYNPYTISIWKDGYLNYSEELDITSYTRPTCQLQTHILPVAIISGELIRHVNMDSEIYFDGTQSTGRGISYSWDIGDGNSSTSPTPSHAYTVPGVYRVILTVTDDYENTSTASIIVIVQNVIPTAHADFDANSVFEDESITFDASGSWDTPSDSLTFLWDFGDGVQSDQIVISHVFQQEGYYMVTLTVTDSYGGENTSTHYITVTNMAPWDVSAGEDVSVYTNDAVVFNGSANDTISDIQSLQYSWDFGDGTKASGKGVTHAYPRSGLYEVNFIVTDNNGASAHALINVTVKDPEIKWNIVTEWDYKIIGDSIISQDDILFFNASHEFDDGSFIYHWNFGNGYSEDGQNVSHNFTICGTFNPWLVVFDGLENTIVFLPEIRVGNAGPGAVVNHGSPWKVNESESVELNASGSWDSPSDMGNLVYIWDFGDGSTGHGWNVSHHYSKSGGYTVTLMVSDGKDIGLAGVLIEVQNLPPSADVGTPGERKASVGQPVIFDASGSTDTLSDLHALNYTWRIDNDTVYGKVVGYTFSKTGDFTVSLIVRDDDGATSEDTVTYHVLKESEPEEDKMKTINWILIGIVVIFLVTIGLLLITRRGVPPEEFGEDEVAAVIESEVDYDSFKPKNGNQQPTVELTVESDVEISYDEVEVVEDPGGGDVEMDEVEKISENAE